MNEMLLVIPVEIYYAHRCWALWNRSWLLAAAFVSLLILFVILVLVIVITYPNNFFIMTRGPLFLTAASSLWCIDWGISVLMILGLRRVESYFLSTQRLVRRMIILSAEAQIIPSLALVAYLLRAIIAPSSTVTYFFMFAPKIWVSTCLIVFITRQSMKKDMESERERRQNTFDHGIAEHPVPNRSAPSSRPVESRPILSGTTSLAGDKRSAHPLTPSSGRSEQFTLGAVLQQTEPPPPARRRSSLSPAMLVAFSQSRLSDLHSSPVDKISVTAPPDKDDDAG